MCETGDFKKKVEFSFQVYDVDGDGAISKAELTDMLKADIVEMSLDMNQEEIDILIDATMKQVSAGADKISMDQYMTYAEANRDKFQAEMTVNVKRRLIGAHWMCDYVRLRLRTENELGVPNWVLRYQSTTG